MAQRMDAGTSLHSWESIRTDQKIGRLRPFAYPNPLKPPTLLNIEININSLDGLEAFYVSPQIQPIDGVTSNLSCKT